MFISCKLLITEVKVLSYTSHIYALDKISLLLLRYHALCKIGSCYPRLAYRSWCLFSSKETRFTHAILPLSSEFHNALLPRQYFVFLSYSSRKSLKNFKRPFCSIYYDFTSLHFLLTTKCTYLRVYNISIFPNLKIIFVLTE